MEAWEKKYAMSEEFREWGRQMPPLRFKADWDVRVIPPFGGAAARFVVEWGGARVSVYADFDDSLGIMGEPYWEIYPNAEGDAERFRLYDTESMMIAIDLSLISPRKTE